MSKAPWVLAGMLTVILATVAVQSQLGPQQTQTGIVGATGEYVGQVLRPDGSPAAGARVGIVVQHSSMFTEVVHMTKTADDGSFRLLLPRATFEELRAIHESVNLVATADGYGMAWKEAAAFFPQEQQSDEHASDASVLKLAVDDTPVTGRVLHSDGTPASRIRVELVSLQSTENEDLGPWLKAVDQGQSYQKLEFQRLLPRRLSGLGLQHFAVTTDDDGRFRFTGLGKNRLAAFQIAGPNVACMVAAVRTVTGEQLVIPGLSYLIDTQGCFGADFTVTVKPSQSVQGIVTDSESGQPLAGLTVRSVGFGDTTGIYALSAVTDDSGRFVLEGFPIGEHNRLVVSAGGDVPYLPAGVSVNTDAGPPPPIEFKMRRGIWVEGTVTDQRTGKPVLASVDAFVPTTNSHLADYPLLTKASIPATVLFRTDGEGRYRIPAIPGRNVLGARLIGQPSISVQRNDQMSNNVVRQNGREYRCLHLPNVHLEGMSDKEESRMWFFHVVPWPIESGTYHQLRSVDIPASLDTFHCDLTL